MQNFQKEIDLSFSLWKFILLSYYSCWLIIGTELDKAMEFQRKAVIGS